MEQHDRTELLARFCSYIRDPDIRSKDFWDERGVDTKNLTEQHVLGAPGDGTQNRPYVGLTFTDIIILEEIVATDELALPDSTEFQVTWTGATTIAECLDDIEKVRQLESA